MRRRLQLLCKRLLQRSQITKSELLTLTRISGKDALTVKPLKAFTNNLERHGSCIKNLNNYLPVSSTLKHDICELQHYIDLYHQNQSHFDDAFNPNKDIEVNAYSLYGIHGFVDPQLDDKPNKLDKEWNELSSIYSLLSLYRDNFKGKHVQIQCESPSVIHMLNSYDAKPSKPFLQSQITKIAAICMEFQINPVWSRADVHLFCNEGGSSVLTVHDI
eukprot:88328_1